MDLKQIGWTYGIDDIEEKIKQYGRNDRHGIEVAYYPTINRFGSVDAYESYLNVLIVSIHKELSKSSKKLAKLTLAYKFSQGEPLREMSLIHFVYNMIMWRPFIVSGITVTEKEIFQPDTFKNSEYASYLDEFADRYRDRFTAGDLSSIMHDMQRDMNKLVVAVGPLFGNSISIYDFWKMARKNKEVYDIMHTEVDLDKMQVSEAESFLRNQTKRLMTILLNEEDENNPLKPMIRAGTGVNQHQVQETMVHAGFKPTLQGDTMPLTANTNLMTHGLHTPESVFTDSRGGRKAAIMQRGVSDAGYFGRHSTFVTQNVTLNEDPNYSCDTVNLVKVDIESPKILTAYIGRFYRVSDKHYKLITKKDQHLIGKTIEIRSPATCGCDDDNICKVCYGTMYNVNYGMHAGGYASIDTNENKTQLGLSARHALATSSSGVSIIDEMGFLVDVDGWLFKLNPSIDAKKYELVIHHNDLRMESEENYEKYDNYFFDRVLFRDVKSQKTYEVTETTDTHFYPSKQFYDLLREKKFFALEDGEFLTISLKEINTEDPFLFLRISNAELTKPIKQLTKFIQKGEQPMKEISDYHEYVRKLNELFRQGGMVIPSVHIEMIIRKLIRNKENPLETPDWTIEQKPNMYTMISMNKAAITSESVISGMMFEKVRTQFKDPLTYKKRGTSLDSLLFVNE